MMIRIVGFEKLYLPLRNVSASNIMKTQRTKEYRRFYSILCSQANKLQKLAFASL
jgi:hypothetical protein